MLGTGGVYVYMLVALDGLAGYMYMYITLNKYTAVRCGHG